MPALKCPFCHKLLAKARGEVEIKCPKCKRIFRFDTNKATVEVCKTK